MFGSAMKIYIKFCHTPLKWCYIFCNHFLG